MPKGDTHSSKKQIKEKQRKERKFAEKNKKNFMSIIIPQDKTKHYIVYIKDHHKGTNSINVITKDNISINVYIPKNFMKRKLLQDMYLLVEKIDIPIINAHKSEYSIIHVYKNEEINDLKKKHNKTEWWYWMKWIDEAINYDDESSESESDSKPNNTDDEDEPSDIDIDAI